jgi:hypothetical protein
LYSIDRASGLQNTSSVAETSSRIKSTIGGVHEDGSEHVCAEYLTPEITIVLSIVASSKMAKTGSEVSARSLLNTSKFPSQLFKNVSSLHLLCVSVACCVNGLI